jgi:hypothetical protein
MPLVDIHHLSKDGTSADRKKTVTGGPAAVEGENLRGLTWLTPADVKILVIG